jgi:DNA segregation ATPase FtsK/SpoIIIE-like protein
MTDLNTLEKKIKVLEKHIQELEAELAYYKEDRELMDALYEKAKVIVTREKKASVIFLQRKLIIDYPRAKRIFDRLKADGINT